MQNVLRLLTIISVAAEELQDQLIRKIRAPGDDVGDEVRTTLMRLSDGQRELKRIVDFSLNLIISQEARPDEKPNNR